MAHASGGGRRGGGCQWRDRQDAPNKWTHTRVVEKLARQFIAQLNPETTYVVTSVFGLVVRSEPLALRVPDLAVFHADRVVEQDGYIHSAPELVVEVLSPANTRSERAAKLQDYESLGVPEVWVVSPEAQTVEVLRLNENRRLATTSLLREGELRPSLPGSIRRYRGHLAQIKSAECD